MRMRTATAATVGHSTQLRRRPRREEVRSEKAPAIGLATSETSAPTATTTPRLASLPTGSMASTWRGSRNWMGVKNAVQMPRLVRARTAMKPGVTRAVGSARGSREGESTRGMRTAWQIRVGVRG